ncbi:MAG TPA: cobyric acid synthase [Syntrophomonadaceae bacterium]|nr:cobyric acid synthase [Syntrophomonadaceae bacterium]
MLKARSIMVQGTSSNVGKSILCTALCRIFYQDGYRTVPFKAQNMALNSVVTADGGEIGRAQGVQAEAAGIQPDVLMNPILIKPKQDMQAQIVVLGAPAGDMSARDYREHFLPHALPLVRDSIEKLKEEYEILVIEGAGSPAEVNLKDRDIVNMKTAELADAPVLLVADIDRGGVFASLIGTLELLEENERQRVKGFIINKFRGDIELLKPGLDFLSQRTGIPVLGVIPFLHEHGIDEEDSVCLSEYRDWGDVDAPINIAVLQLPRISNFTDIKAFIGLPDTHLRYVKKGQAIGHADLLIIPGTKNSILDLLYLKEEGLFEEILELAGRGVLIAGVCGGYQMLGIDLLDPEGSEAGIGSQKGLGLLPCVTTFSSAKSTHQAEAQILTGNGFWSHLAGQTVRGYEIHMGQTQILPGCGTLMQIHKRSGQPAEIMEGACSENGRVFGSYMHGFFDNSSVMLALMNTLRGEKGLSPLVQENLPSFQYGDRYDRLAAVVRQAIPMEEVYKIMDGWGA